MFIEAINILLLTEQQATLAEQRRFSPWEFNVSGFTPWQFNVYRSHKHFAPNGAASNAGREAPV